MTTLWHTHSIIIITITHSLTHLLTHSHIRSIYHHLFLTYPHNSPIPLPPPLSLPPPFVQTWSQRIDRVLFCFHDRGTERSRWMSWAAHNCTVCDYCNESLPLRELWFHYTQYRYVFSPYGNGFDCFRSFEILLLGAIPVFHYFPGVLAYEQTGLKAVYVTRETDVNNTSLAAWNQLHPTGQGPLNLLTREHWARRAFQNITLPPHNITDTDSVTNNSTDSPMHNTTSSPVFNRNGVLLPNVTLMDEQPWNSFR